MNPTSCRSCGESRHRTFQVIALCTFFVGWICAGGVFAQPAPNQDSPKPAATPAAAPGPDQEQEARERAFVEMLSGATLEGSFTSTGAGRDPTKLAREKYTIGEVRKLVGNIWLIPARIQYGEHDVTLPVTVPLRWAGDTPVIVVDNVPLPGFGTVSARVLFFADHYAGYWKHGDHGGHLFGLISRKAEPAASAAESAAQDEPSIGNSPADQKPDE